jgi:cyclase
MTNKHASKRIIFQLIYDSGYFCLSRNFRLQRVGDLSWLLASYDFPKLSRSIDELIIVDASRGERDTKRFTDTVKRLSKELFAPLTIGGGVRDISMAETYLASGANSSFVEDQQLIFDLAHNFGKQFLIMSVDLFKQQDKYISRIHNAASEGPDFSQIFLGEAAGQAGEIVLRSIERDGTGNGLDLGMLKLIPNDIGIPILVAGGVGNASHILLGLSDEMVSGVVTANLLNFVGDGMADARRIIINHGIKLADFT